ncbi:SLOG family protein, partial [Enterococcus faecalis]|uniref:SLOG family protein n=1 Tax=Enterococcus faecalis TaxID=1351 RepID=UPI003D6B4A8E
VLKKALASYIEAGVEWILISGTLGVELWTAEVVGALKTAYPEVQLGLLYPFKDFGNHWNGQNRELLTKAKSLADYINSA